MKKSLLIATALATIAGSAFAADLPSYKSAPPPPPPPPPMWTGFYVGLNAGYTWASDTNSTINLFPFAFGAWSVGGGNNGGFIGGGQIGYNWQFGPQFVAGVEADIQGVAGNQGTTTVFAGPLALATSNRIDYLGTVRGRLGWLFTPTLLLYGTGGLAYGGVNSTTWIALPGAFGTGGFSDTRVGWTAGGGVEWMFWPNWSAKVEYLYYDLGATRYATPVTNAAGAFVAIGETNTNNRGHIVRAGVNYHFNWGSAPVMARY